MESTLLGETHPHCLHRLKVLCYAQFALRLNFCLSWIPESLLKDVSDSIIVPQLLSASLGVDEQADVLHRVVLSQLRSNELLQMKYLHYLSSSDELSWKDFLFEVVRQLGFLLDEELDIHHLEGLLIHDSHVSSLVSTFASYEVLPTTVV